MNSVQRDGAVIVEQASVVIPDLTVKDLLSAIPAHCFQRSVLRSSQYIIGDALAIATIYKATVFLEQFISPEYLSLPCSFLYTAAWISLWAFYGFAAGLPATGLWVIAHECGHQAFSESKGINNSVGWILHSALGVPYHSWRISHAKHHASTSHMTQDQAYVPPTRSQRGLPNLNDDGEDLLGSRVTEEVMRELKDAIGDSPIGTIIGVFVYLVFGWPSYIIWNAAGQKCYPSGTNHLNPNAVIFRPDQRGQIILSNVGIALWLIGLAAASTHFDVGTVFRIYFQAYLWVNHWIILITFLQHTDPLLPHYRAPEFTFPRGALATFDRQLMGDLGPIGAWIGALATHGLSETHVAHHVASKIPHYHAWEATAALRRLLKKHGISLQGRPGGWSEMYRVYRECSFVEDEGDILFYKNAKGLAASKPLVKDVTASDSGIEIDD